MNPRFFLTVVLMLTPLTLSACGGGGGSASQNTTPQNPTVVTKSVSNTVVAALELGTQGPNIRPTLLPSTSGSVSLQTRFKGDDSDLSVIARIFQEVQNFKSASSNPSNKIFNTITPIPFEQSCGSGFTNDNNTPDTSDDSFSISLSCSGGGPGGAAAASGSFSSTPITASGVLVQYRLLYNNYTLTNRFRIQLNQAQTSNLFSTESSMRNGTVLLSVAPGNCFRDTVFENVAGTFNISGFDRRDADGNNVFEVNEEFALTNLVVTIAETPQCANGPVTITLNGTRSFTDRNDSTRSVTSTYNNVQLVVTPTSKVINTLFTKGLDHSLSGTVTVTSPNLCVDGTHTISTETPFFLATGASCAVLGKNILTDTTSGQISAVLATPGGGLNVDVGDDGTIEQSFADCEEAFVCTP